MVWVPPWPLPPVFSAPALGSSSCWLATGGPFGVRFRGGRGRPFLCWLRFTFPWVLFSGSGGSPWWSVVVHRNLWFCWWHFVIAFEFVFSFAVIRVFSIWLYFFIGRIILSSYWIHLRAISVCVDICATVIAIWGWAEWWVRWFCFVIYFVICIFVTFTYKYLFIAAAIYFTAIGVPFLVVLTMMIFCPYRHCNLIFVFVGTIGIGHWFWLISYGVAWDSLIFWTAQRWPICVRCWGWFWHWVVVRRTTSVWEFSSFLVIAFWWVHRGASFW